MLRNGRPFRVWGLLESVVKSADVGAWAFVGCVSMEHRSTVALLLSRKHWAMSSELMFSIADSSESRFFARSMELTRVNQRTLMDRGVSVDVFRERNLLDPFGAIESDIDKFLDGCGAENLIFDITSMPKKFFFFVIKRAIQLQDKFRNILATYSEPERYSEAPLAENPQHWSTLPGFDGPLQLPEGRRVVIAMGFEPLGLPDLVMQGEFAGVETHLLFPFPTPPDRIRKNWEFAKDLFPNPPSALRFQHVDGLNVPDVFDVLSDIGRDGETQMTLAPYGPKPVSLAMALYAGRHDSGKNATAVYYTQPMAYNPDYSSGLRTIGGKLGIHCYAIKRLDQFLY